MKQTTIEASATGPTEYKCVDRRGNAGGEFLIIIDLEAGTGVVDFEFTPDDCIEGEPDIWIQHNILKDVTESCASTINVPFQAFRMNIKSNGVGTIKARVVQGGFHDF